MKEVHRVVLLSDDATSRLGLLILEQIKELLYAKGIEVWHQRILLAENVAEAIYQFDRISLELKPDLLIVADFACIKMQSEQEEPFYNNFAIPVVHLLFRRPWEYEAFMVWRCNFTTRLYCLQERDVFFIRTYYPRVPNVLALPDDLFLRGNDANALPGSSGNWKIAWLYSRQDYKEQRQVCCQMPEYMRTIHKCWEKELKDDPELYEAEAMEKCLMKLGIDSSREEFLDIMYLMRTIFPCHAYGELGVESVPTVNVRKEVLHRYVVELLNLDFPISLL